MIDFEKSQVVLVMVIANLVILFFTALLFGPLLMVLITDFISAFSEFLGVMNWNKE